MNHLTFEKNFADGLERIRVELGYSQAKMAKELELSLSAYKRIITYDTERIDVYLAYKIYKMTGKLAYEIVGMSDPYLDIKRKIMGLSPSQLSYIDGIIDFEKAFASSHEDSEDYVTVFVPTGNMADGMIYDSSSVEKVNIAAERKRYGNRISCGIRITSNHLHPAYNQGDILLICREVIRDGDTGVFINKNNGCAYIRKFYQTSPCRLEPVSAYGEVFYVNSEDKKDMDQWIKFGYVITKIR